MRIRTWSYVSQGDDNLPRTSDDNKYRITYVYPQKQLSLIICMVVCMNVHISFCKDEARLPCRVIDEIVNSVGLKMFSPVPRVDHSYVVLVATPLSNYCGDAHSSEKER